MTSAPVYTFLVILRERDYKNTAVNGAKERGLLVKEKNHTLSPCMLSIIDDTRSCCEARSKRSNETGSLR